MSEHEHSRAVDRLSAARDERARLVNGYSAAAASQGDLSAQAELHGAREEVTARERWLESVGSDGPVGSSVSQSPTQQQGAQ
jgi:hypothetical protein